MALGSDAEVIGNSRRSRGEGLRVVEVAGDVVSAVEDGGGGQSDGFVMKEGRIEEEAHERVEAAAAAVGNGEERGRLAEARGRRRGR